MDDRRFEDVGVEWDDTPFADDAFLDDLSRGSDPSDGADPLAGLLLALKDEVDAPLPPAPYVLGGAVAPATADTQVFASVPTAPVAPAAEISQAGSPEPIDVERYRARRRGIPAPVSGLIGAAAATLVIAGGGTAVYNATPGSALWPASTALFGDHAAVVELASTLEEADNRNANGDVAGALALLEQAKQMAKDLGTRDRSVKGSKDAPATSVPPSVTTVTVSPEAPAPVSSAESTPAPAPAPAPVESAAPVAPVSPVSPAAPESDGSDVSATPQLPTTPRPSTVPAPVPDGSEDAGSDVSVTSVQPVPDGGEAPSSEVAAPVSENTGGVSDASPSVEAPTKVVAE